MKMILASHICFAKGLTVIDVFKVASFHLLTAGNLVLLFLSFCILVTIHSYLRSRANESTS